jgi:hypothetical protein
VQRRDTTQNCSKRVCRVEYFVEARRNDKVEEEKGKNKANEDVLEIGDRRVCGGHFFLGR